MTDLTPICALGGQQVRAQSFGALAMTEAANLALASLVVPGGPMPTPFGLTLPAAGGLSANDTCGAFWTGPGQWMVEAPGRADQDFATALAAEAPGARVTEQTDAWVAIDITGPGIDALLERLVNLPPKALQPGCAVRTGLHHMSVFVLRRADDRLTVLGIRSAAGSLWHALETAIQHLTAQG